MTLLHGGESFWFLVTRSCVEDIINWYNVWCAHLMPKRNPIMMFWKVEGRGEVILNASFQYDYFTVFERPYKSLIRVQLRAVLRSWALVASIGANISKSEIHISWLSISNIRMNCMPFNIFCPSVDTFPIRRNKFILFCESFLSRYLPKQTMFISIRTCKFEKCQFC